MTVLLQGREMAKTKNKIENIQNATNYREEDPALDVLSFTIGL
jgi:hypothetical protein